MRGIIRARRATTVEGMNTLSSRILPLAAVLSAAFALVSAVWLWRPAWNGFDSTDQLPAELLLDPDRLPVLGLGLGLLGAVAAVIAVSYDSTDRTRPQWLLPLAAVLTVGAMSLIGTQSIAAAGYSLALVMPLIATVLLVQVVRTGGRGRWLALAGAGLLLVVSVLTGVLTSDSIEVFGLIGSGLLDQVPLLLVPTLLVALALTWTVVGVGAARDGGSLDRLAGWVLRHRTVITVVAALGPLPYALVRLTWFTPWKLLAPDTEIPVQMVLWGLLLSTGAWLGFFLTLGLVQRWGEIFPRWMPFVSGRPVPVAAAAVPGGLVATVVTASAVPFLMLSASRPWIDTVVGAVVFPFWLWGPALGLAVWGYVLHRQGGGRMTAVGTGRSAPVSEPATSSRSSQR